MTEQFGEEWHTAAYDTTTTWGEVLLTPARIFAPAICHLLNTAFFLKGIAHFTAGGIGHEVYPSECEHNSQQGHPARKSTLHDGNDDRDHHHQRAGQEAGFRRRGVHQPHGLEGEPDPQDNADQYTAPYRLPIHRPKLTVINDPESEAGDPEPDGKKKERTYIVQGRFDQWE